MHKILVSRCLLGHRVRYDGGASGPFDLLEQWIAEGAKVDQGLDVKTDLLKELRKLWAPPAILGKYAFPVSVTALVFTPDGKQLVTSGHHELCVWDVATGTLVKRVSIRSRRAMALTYLADGKLVMAGGRPGEEAGGQEVRRQEGGGEESAR